MEEIRTELFKEWGARKMQASKLNVILEHQDMLVFWRDYYQEEFGVLERIDEAVKENLDLYDVVMATPRTRMVEMILEDIFKKPIRELEGNGTGVWDKCISGAWYGKASEANSLGVVCDLPEGKPGEGGSLSIGCGDMRVTSRSPGENAGRERLGCRN